MTNFKSNLELTEAETSVLEAKAESVRLRRVQDRDKEQLFREAKKLKWQDNVRNKSSFKIREQPRVSYLGFDVVIKLGEPGFLNIFSSYFQLRAGLNN